jgi:DNA-directed RNA polymerase subunit beta
MMRNAMGDNAPMFMATQLLKAFGMTQDEIRRIFKDDLYIINTLYKEPYNHQNILDESEIIGIRKTLQDISTNKVIARGSPIDTKLKQTVALYYKEKKISDQLRNEYETLFNSIADRNNELNAQLVSSANDDREKIQRQLNSISKDVEKVLDKLNKQEKLLRDLIDVIITEKAAKDLISTLSISVKSIENFASSQKDTICYQDVITRHFMDNRLYDLTSAGRYKLQRKLRVSERLYGRIASENILDKDDKVLIEKGTLILKNEIDIIKKAASSRRLKQVDKVKLGSETKISKKFDNAIEIFEIYTDNDLCDVTTSIVGPYELIDSNALTITDFVSVISYTVGLPHGIGQYDDIDHLGNKRLRLIHEQLKNKLNIGMARVEKHVKEKLASISIATANEEQQAKTDAKTTVKSLMNTKPFQLMIKNFFNSYQLTQFTDQQNPLSELANKRRISAMGDGGISREDPNLDIRDVHYSHYSRICPIETPEGMNIGLIMSLAAFTKVDENGFLVAPYHRVINGVVQKEVE